MKLYNLNSDSLFCDFFESYNAASRANETTIQCRRHRLETFASSIYYEPWHVLTKADMLNWRTNLEGITEIATRTKNAIIGTIKQVSKHAYAVYDQYDVGSVLSTFSLTLKDHHEIKIITVEDFYKMMAFETDEELEAFFTFLYRTGCRKGEARALRVEDYDPIKHCIYIYKSMRRYEDSLKTTKTSNSRYVILDQETDNLVRYQVNKNSKYLFGNTKPLPLSRITDHYKDDIPYVYLDGFSYWSGITAKEYRFLSSVIAVIASILVFSLYCAMEDETGMVMLENAYGKQKDILICKIRNVVFFSLLLTTGLFIPFIFRIHSIVPFDNLLYPASSLSLFSSLPEWIPLLVIIIMQYLLLFTLICSVFFSISLMNRYVHKTGYLFICGSAFYFIVLLVWWLMVHLS